MGSAAGLITQHHSALLQACQRQQQAKVGAGLVFQFEVEGIHFSCFYDALLTPGHVCIRCEVFDLVDGVETTVLRRLLTDNCLRHQQGLPIFSLNIEQGCVVALWNMDVLNSTPSVFEAQVRRWVGDVRQWQHVSMSEHRRPPPQGLTLLKGGRRAQ